jgi:hypothetical protein
MPRWDAGTAPRTSFVREQERFARRRWLPHYTTQQVWDPGPLLKPKKTTLKVLAKIDKNP